MNLVSNMTGGENMTFFDRDPWMGSDQNAEKELIRMQRGS